MEYCVLERAVAVALWSEIYYNKFKCLLSMDLPGYASSATRTYHRLAMLISLRSTLTGPIAPTTTPPIPSNSLPAMNIPAEYSLQHVMYENGIIPLTIDCSGTESSPNNSNNTSKEHRHPSAIPV
jgi:hypothetical protein